MLVGRPPFWCDDRAKARDERTMARIVRMRRQSAMELAKLENKGVESLVVEVVARMISCDDDRCPHIQEVLMHEWVRRDSQLCPQPQSRDVSPQNPGHTGITVAPIGGGRQHCDPAAPVRSLPTAPQPPVEPPSGLRTEAPGTLTSPAPGASPGACPERPAVSALRAYAQKQQQQGKGRPKKEKKERR